MLGMEMQFVFQSLPVGLVPHDFRETEQLAVVVT